jgi:hypothetical protein
MSQACHVGVDVVGGTEFGTVVIRVGFANFAVSDCKTMR